MKPSVKEYIGFVFLFLVGVIVLGMIFTGIAHAESADRFVVSGGSGSQNQEAVYALESSLWDWDYGWEAYPQNPMTFVASMPPYWYEDGEQSVLLQNDETLKDLGIYYFRDDLGGAIGLAGYPAGDTFIRKYYPSGTLLSGPLLNEVVLHEAAHARVWFVWMKMYPEHWHEWTRLSTLGIPPEAVSVSWDTMPAEHHAEHHRWAYADCPQKNDYARTRLTAMTKTQVRSFHDAVVESTKPPTPPPPEGSQKVTVNPGPYRTGLGLNVTTVTGTWYGGGTVWFVPTQDWGQWATATQAVMSSDGTYFVNVAIPWTGALTIDFEIVLYWDDEHKYTHKGRATFDRTSPPFPDVSPITEDFEIYHAAWFARHKSLMQGYPDGLLRPYRNLLKRHVWLICDRAKNMGYPIGSPPASWYYSYSNATRGEVREAVPGLDWDSDRVEEVLTRSQLLRLILRKHDGAL